MSRFTNLRNACCVMKNLRLIIVIFIGSICSILLCSDIDQELPSMDGLRVLHVGNDRYTVEYHVDGPCWVSWGFNVGNLSDTMDLFIALQPEEESDEL